MIAALSRRRLLAGSAAAAALVGAGPAGAQIFGAPRAELWDLWTAHTPGAAGTIDHGVWSALLQRYSSLPGDGIVRFSYGMVSQADRAALAGYLDRLSATAISAFDRPEQFAFWVNLYNALTVAVVLDHYPVASIRDIDISPGLFSNGPWGANLIEVEGVALTLDDIEHRILRPIWQDPRIHYAVNCASIGCPNLQSSAFTAANTEALLEAGAVDYINHWRGASVRRNRLTVSSIFDWFPEDFGNSDFGVIAHLRRYAGPALTAQLAGIDRIHDHDYDWRLNAPEVST